MPHLFSKCPYCKRRFYFDAQIEKWPVDDPIKRQLFSEYLKYHQIVLPCPYCKKDIRVDAISRKTFKYDKLINKLNPDMVEFFKKAKLMIPPFVTMDQIVPENKQNKKQKEPKLSFEMFSEVLDQSEKPNKGVISFDFDNTIGLTTWDKEENDFKRGEDGHSIQHPNLRIIDLIKKYIAEGYKVVLVTSRFEVGGRDDIVEKLKRWNVPITELYFTNGYFKVETLKRLHALKHYDDDMEELKRLKHTKIKGIYVNDND